MIHRQMPTPIDTHGGWGISHAISLRHSWIWPQPPLVKYDKDGINAVGICVYFFNHKPFYERKTTFP